MKGNVEDRMFDPNANKGALNHLLQSAVHDDTHGFTRLVPRTSEPVTIHGSAPPTEIDFTDLAPGVRKAMYSKLYDARRYHED